MKVLLLTHRVPYPPNRGDRIRSYHLLKFLAARSDVSLACMTDEPVAGETERVLADMCQRHDICRTSRIGRASRAAWSLARGRSATAGYFWHPRLAASIRQWSVSEKFDAVVCYCSGMYCYTRLSELRGVPVLVDLVDVDSKKWADCAAHASLLKNRLYGLESLRVEQLERQIASEADAITLISTEELELLRRVAPGTEGYVVGNGVDLEFFRPEPAFRVPEPQTCCFVGVLDYPPNSDALQWFVEAIWPSVRASVADARFLIVGKSPGRAVKRFAQAPGVELHANVPDVRPFLAQSAVAIAPLRFARGVQNKVLEAMAMGKAVVATPQSLKGLRAQLGIELLEAQNSDDWSIALQSLLNDPAQVRHLGRAARNYVEKNHGWEACLQPFAEYLDLRVSTRSGGSPRCSSPKMASPTPASSVAT